MRQYTSFASVYDTFMDNIPYPQWCSYVAELLWDHGVSRGVIAELGCGTGTVAMNLAHYGYKVIGIDNSKEMLSIAARKMTRDYKGRVLYMQQDMRDFALKRPVRAIVSICDSMNYLLHQDDLIRTLRCVRENLRSGGIFIFDMKTCYFYEHILGDSTIADNYPGSSFIWENHYNSRTGINSYRISIFARTWNGYYRRFCELHRQKGYTIPQITDAIAASGLKLIAVYDAFSRDEARPDSERIYFIVKKEDIDHE